MSYIENFEFLGNKVANKPIANITLANEQIIDLILMSLKLYETQKISPQIEKPYKAFINYLNIFKNNPSFENQNTPFYIAYDSSYELPLYILTNGKVVINFGNIEKFPPQQINMLFAIIFYFFGYYIAIKNYKDLNIYIYDIILIFIGLFLQIFGRKHALLTYKIEDLEKIKLILGAYIYKKMTKTDEEIDIHTWAELRRKLELHHIPNFKITLTNEEKLETMVGTFNLLKELNLINLSKDTYVYSIYNYFGSTGLVMFDNWMRFSAFILATTYPSTIANSYIKKMNSLAYNKIHTYLYNNLAMINDFDKILFKIIGD